MPFDRPLKEGQVDDPPRNRRLEAVIEKRSMINLVHAFSVSVKHFLRGEGGIYYEDLYPKPVPSASSVGLVLITFKATTQAAYVFWEVLASRSTLRRGIGTTSM